jgi:Zn-dependent peptidase ImmA (M78 family)
MISADDARVFAEKHFPEAPEKLAAAENVSLRESPMSGCDGWCLAVENRSIIRLNSLLTPTRKRFTLAHELGHLILGVPGVVGESFEDMVESDSVEERRVNELASELLMPTGIVRSILPAPPVVAAGIRALAKRANVSDLSAAVRVCNLATEIGLVNASVVQFDEDRVKWQWSKSLRMGNETAHDLLVSARKVESKVFRHRQQDGQVVVASIIENPVFGSATLFVQLLPANLAMTESRHERRKQLELELFSSDSKFQQRVAGLFGAHKPRVANLTKFAAVAEFWKRHEHKLAGTPLDSDTGREYVELRIGDWY